MSRTLTLREREVLMALIERGTETGDRLRATPARRLAWLMQVDLTRAGRRCDCGACPTIELEGENGPTAGFSERVVLEGWVDEAGILLFIDDDRLSDLELYPSGDHKFDSFPPAESIHFSSRLTSGGISRVGIWDA